MQTVWSRIAQTRASCRCPSCAATASGIARRATTATSKRPMRYFTSSTLLYSGIFAAAATTDAVAKEKRRQQWDKAIADVKHELGDDAAPLEPRQESRTIRRATDSSQDKEQLEGSDEIEAIFENFRPFPTAAIWPANTGADLERHNVPPQSIFAKDHTRDRATRKRWSEKKLRTTELSIDKLVLRILLYLDDNSWRSKTAYALPRRFRRSFLKPKSELEALLAATQRSLDQLRSLPDSTDPDQYPARSALFARYYQDEAGHFVSMQDDLNNALLSMFQRRAEGTLRLGDLLAKLCYNLSTSSTPPSLSCYNTLLNGFTSRHGDSGVTNMVIKTMEESRVRMNETSMICILNHYTTTRDLDRFSEFVRKMRGQLGGLALARPGIQINEAGQDRVVKKNESDKVIQKPYAVPAVFEALIQGILHFNGFDSALEVCRSMGQEGWGLSMRGLRPLLSECVKARNWTSGRDVWEQIKLVQAKSRRQQRAEKIQLRTYATMLRLCVACNQPTDYHQIFAEALSSSCSHRILLRTIQERDGVLRRWSPPLTSSWSLPSSLDLGAIEHDSRPEHMSSTNEAENTSLALENLRVAEDQIVDIPGHEAQGSEAYVIEQSLEPRSETPMPSGDTTMPKSKPGDIVVDKAVPSLPTSTRHQSQYLQIVCREQLAGNLPASFELDDYESRERPMNLHT